MISADWISIRYTTKLELLLNFVGVFAAIRAGAAQVRFTAV